MRKKCQLGFVSQPSEIEMPCVNLPLYKISTCAYSLSSQTNPYTGTHTLTHLTATRRRRRRRWGVGGLIGLAPLFHLTEQKGSRLCQTASQRGKRESASRAYVGSASIGRYGRGQALSSFLQLSQQSLESALAW